MLIPSIDIQRGRIVQLVQGETLAVETSDIQGWVERFRSQPKVQLIDLDAAKAEGSNDALRRSICAHLPCRVGGGVRSIERARQLLDDGAAQVIVGSALFGSGGVEHAFADRIAHDIGRDRLIAAVDSRGGKVVIHGWRTALDISAVEAVRSLEPYCGGFLYTIVDREGLMAGTDIPAILAVRDATTRRVAAAGGITSLEEVEQLDSLGVDAVVGMAIYTGHLRC